MNILFLSSSYKPNIGGVEKHVSEIAERLAKNNKVTIITPHQKGSKKRESASGVGIIRISNLNIKFLGLLVIWTGVFKYKKLFDKADVIHAHDSTIWLFLYKLFNPNIKIYSTFHGWEGKYPMPLKNKLLRKLSHRISYKTISIGEFVDKYYKTKSDKVLYGGVNKPEAKMRKQNRFVYVGRLSEDTGLLVFLQAIKNLRNLKIDFCGDGELRAKCEQIGVVHGFVDPNHFMSRSKYCFISGYLTILEALSHNCICLASYDDDLKRDYYKLSPFRSYLNFVNSERDLIKALKAKHKKFDIESYSWGKAVREYENLWKA